MGEQGHKTKRPAEAGRSLDQYQLGLEAEYAEQGSDVRTVSHAAGNVRSFSTDRELLYWIIVQATTDRGEVTTTSTS